MRSKKWMTPQPYALSQAFELPPIEGHKDWCWSFPFASAEACCFRAEATSVQVQGRCWPEALIGVAFLLCCLSVEHAATVKARELLADRWSISPGGLLSPPALLEDLAGGFGPLHSAYHAKDAGVLLQLVMALPVVWAHLGATARTTSKQVPVDGFSDIGRWLRAVKAAFAPGLEKVSVGRLELYSLRDSGNLPEIVADGNLELLTSGKKISKLISLGRGLRENDAFQLRVRSQDKSEPDAWSGNKELAMAAEEAAAAAARLHSNDSNGAASPGSGHAGYWCEACNAHCSSATAWKQHYASKHHQRRRRLLAEGSGGWGTEAQAPSGPADSANPWSRGMSALAQFPCRRAGTLDVSTKFFDLSESEKELLKLYLVSSFNGEEELLKAFNVLLQLSADHLRIKEVFETIEVWKKVVSHLQRCNAMRKERGLPVLDRIYDVASGHGLLAVLLAYRFPHTEVIALDLEKRAGFEHYVEAVNSFGSCVEGKKTCLANLSFVVGKFEDLSEGSASGIAYVCVHGCNELNFAVLRRAKEKLAAWLVVPCCIRDGLTDICVRCAGTEQGDDSRHAIMLALEMLKWMDGAEASVASSSGPGRWNRSFEAPASAHPWRVEPGWEILMVELQPPPHQLPLATIPISAEDVRSHGLDSKLWDPPLSIASLLQRHVWRVQQLVRGSYEPLKTVWELSRELTLLSQSLVLFLTTLDLRRSLNRPGPQFRLADVPVHSGCCERYRILSGLLERLRQDLGKTKLVYVEVGVADGLTALFLLHNVRCPACGHTWLTFFDDDFFNCVQCGRIRFECPQCRTQSEASRNYCRYCLSGCYDRTIVISLVVQQLQDCSGLLVKCVTLGGEEILVTTLVEEDTVGDFRPKAVEAVLAACGFKQGEDGEFCPDEQLREWERWHDVSFVWFLSIGASLRACSSGASVQDAAWRRCRDGGGELLFARLQFGYTAAGQEFFAGLEVLDLPDSADGAGDDGNNGDGLFDRACVPAKCAGVEKIAATPCAAIKGWLIRSLLDEHGKAYKDTGDLGIDHVFTTVLREHRWLVNGVEPGEPAASTSAVHSFPIPARMDGESSASFVKVAVLSHHAPLANVFAEHIDHYAMRAGLEPFDYAYFSVCYLCRETSGCEDRKVPSRADALCEYFHSSDVSFQQFYEVADDVVHRTGNSDMLVCYGLAFCHFMFSLSPKLPRLQFLGMNPLQSAPASLSGMLLLDLARRADQGDAIFCTSTVTWNLLAYHLGPAASQVASLTLFRATLTSDALKASWELNRKVLLASSFLMQVSAVYLAMRSALLQVSGFEFVEQTHNTPWSFATFEDVQNMLDHFCAIYFPEHPYKNYFNDMYAMLLPIFTPTLEFLAHIWQQLHDMEESGVYDGWFSRAIPRIRLRPADDDDPLPPFDLGSNGLQKVLKWTAAADYFHFPGVMTFNGLADLTSKLRSQDLQSSLEDARFKMLQHVQSRREDALRKCGQVLDHLSARAVKRENSALPSWICDWSSRLPWLHAYLVENQPKLTVNSASCIAFIALTIMASQGATLQNYNNELVKSIEDLREKREELNRQILKEEEDKAKIQKDTGCCFSRKWRRCYSDLWLVTGRAAGFIEGKSLPLQSEPTARRHATFAGHQGLKLMIRIPMQELSILTDRLQKINESLVRKTQARNEYDKTIQDTPWPMKMLLMKRRKGGHKPSSFVLVHLHASSVELDQRQFGDGSSIHEDPRVLADAAARAETRNREPDEEEVGLGLSIDGLKGQLERLLSALRPVQDRAHLLPMDSVEAATKFREAGLVADAVFLDGDHSASGIRRDLAAWVPVLGDGGLLAGHDFSWEHPGILEKIFLERAGSELYLAPDHVFYWFQRSNQSDVHARKRLLIALGIAPTAPQSQGHTPCTLVAASEIIANDKAGGWMPGNRRRRGPKGPANKESALSIAADGESEPQVAAFRGAVAMDVKTGGAPLLIEVSSHLESITKVLFSQESLEKTNLAEALWPILEGSGWEEERIDAFCSTCWEAARKAGLRRAVQDRPQPTSRNPHQVLQRALSILAETHAQELVQEEEEQLSRSARRASKAGRASEQEVVMEDADDAASQCPSL
eukprot:s5793_g2.t4